jgi:citrate synthase
MRKLSKVSEVVIDPSADGSAPAQDFHMVASLRYDFVGGANHAVIAVFVHPGQHVERVVPASEDHHVAGCGVGERLGFGHAVAKDLDLDVAVFARAAHVELDLDVVRQLAPQP